MTSNVDATADEGILAEAVREHTAFLGGPAVTKAERQAYQQELRLAAKRLGLAAHGDMETAIVIQTLATQRATAPFD
jgi:S-adenosylhomocysteine hydrolase